MNTHPTRARQRRTTEVTDGLGNLLRQARLSHKLTQTSVGRSVGVGQSTVSSWESGSARPTFVALSDLATLLHLNLGTMASLAAEPMEGAPVDESKTLGRSPLARS